MDFGSKADKVHDALKNRQPTYLVAPHFSFTPASATTKGPLDLGTIVADLGRYRPINDGASNRIPIPEDQRYVDIIEDVSNRVTSSRGGEVGVFAKILDQSIGGDVSLRGQRSNEDVFTIDKLETRYFFPSMGYINQCLQLEDVKAFNENVDHKVPIYLITGLKIAWGAKVATVRKSEMEHRLEGGVEAPAGVVDLGVGGRVGLSSDSGLVSSYGKPRDFVLGIQLQKIRYKKRSLFGKGGLKVEDVRKGTVLYSDEYIPEPDESLEDEFEVELEELDDGAVKGMTRMTGTNSKGEEESWLVPAEEA